MKITYSAQKNQRASQSHLKACVHLSALSTLNQFQGKKKKGFWDRSLLTLADL